MFDTAWVKKWQDAVNRNRPMSWIGKHFTANLLFGFGAKEYVVCFQQGKLAEVSDTLGPETRYQLAIRGPPSGGRSSARKRHRRCTTTCGRWPIRCTGA